MKDEWKCNDGSKPWHCSPTNFKSGTNNYVHVDTFTIVQDPYTRMISEYYTFVKKKSLLQERNIVITDIDDVNFMNEWIVNAADTAMKKGVCYAGHCIPMHKYVYDTNGKRVITHVLKVEHLEEEFRDLMKRYKLSSSVTLEDAHMRKEGVLGVEDLSPKAIEKINEWGKLDFDYFGYEMRNPYHDETSKKNEEKSTVSDTTAVAANSKKNGPDVVDDTSTPFLQNERGLHKLEFVHIAKTGGTSIELAGKSRIYPYGTFMLLRFIHYHRICFRDQFQTASQVGIAWGICKFEEYWSWETRCKPILPFREHIKIQQFDAWKCAQKAWPWHCPPHNYESQQGVNKFEGVDTFTVVRNPYNLMISEYYYLFQKKPHLVKDLVENMNDGELNDPKFMNKWIVDAANRAIKDGHCYYAHCIPQHKFAYVDGNRFIDHVLKMENLDDEFSALMERYQLPVKLMHANKTPMKGVSGTKLGVEDLSEEAIMKINEWAGPDFEYFGYEKLDPSSKAKKSRQ